MPRGVKKPAIGQKLNVPSVITIFKNTPKKGMTTEQMELFLRNMLTKLSEQNKEHENDMAEFISYDHKTFEWVFKVPHFTKWGDDNDEEERPVFESLKKPVVFTQQITS